METRSLATQFVEDPINTLIGIAFFALIIFLIYRHHKKKKAAKNKKRQPSEVTVTISDRVPSFSSGNNHNYGDYEKLISIAKFQNVMNKQYVVFDLETTGLDADSDQIIEIGAVRVEKGRITDKYHQMVNPKILIPKAASDKNHITDDMVKDAPTIDQVLPDFLAFVGSDILAAHNGGFDASFLDNACKRHHFAAPEKYFDTMRLSVYWPNLPNRKLETFLKAAGIHNNDAHRALSDAQCTAELIIKSMDKIK